MEHGKDRRLDDLLASYGAGRNRWPADERNAQGTAQPGAEEDARRIDLLLSLASEPTVPAGAEARLLRRLSEERPPAEVISFAPRPKPRPVWRAAAALPLAASLALGIYLGAQGSLDALLPTAITGGIALNDETPDDLGGVGEADAYAEESLT